MEVLVSMGLLAILSGIAVVGYNYYTDETKTRLVRLTLHKMEESLVTCLAYNKWNIAKCNEIPKIKFVLPNGTMRTNKRVSENKDLFVKIHASSDNSKICVSALQKKDGVFHPRYYTNQKDKRACTQYENGKLIRRCFENTGINAGCKQGVCCFACPNTVQCEFGKGAKEPA